jgi:chromosome segregation ATPase
MNAKELVALNEQMLAFNSLMKGELAKEVADATAALEALGSAQTLQADRDSLGQAKANLEAEKASVEASFEAISHGLDSRTLAVQEAEAALAKDQSDLAQAKQELEAAQADFAGVQAQLQSDLAQVRSELATKLALCDQDRIELDKGFADIAARELVVSQKLAAMKAIV